MIKRILNNENLGYNFIVDEEIPSGCDEYYLRDAHSKNKSYRNLTESEITILRERGNQSNNWADVWVSDIFDVTLISRCSFYGKVRIGALEQGTLEHNDMRLRIGLYDSTIISCDIGDYNVINNVHYMSHYIIKDNTVLYNIGELHTSKIAKFGNGIVKENEKESVRISLEIRNENGGRDVLPFNGMLTSDAWIWSKFRDDDTLLHCLKEMTDTRQMKKKGYYGIIGEGCVIKNCQIVKDVNVGDAAYIKGGNKLKNLTINSSYEAPTQLGEGCELVNGIIGQGCHIFYGVKAVRFILRDFASLKYGARLINSILGENSTISCCEVLNSLIFPGHEQHHNNSFLIASTIYGQSNIAAGATIGSNHNSRAADGEIIAGRGFWPGLSVSLKHNCKFASYILLSKGAYPAELNILFPFALIGNNEQSNTLIISPAYWWQYNMYALTRNSWKYGARDARITKHQQYEYDYLAPDTIQEILTALEKIEQLVSKKYDCTVDAAKNMLLNEQVEEKLFIRDKEIDASGREILFNKLAKSYIAYREMIHFFSMKTIAIQAIENHDGSIVEVVNEVEGKRTRWTNLGGQLVRNTDVEALKNQIKSKKITTWEGVHQLYALFNEKYPLHKLNDAVVALSIITEDDVKTFSKQEWKRSLEKAKEITQKIENSIYLSRKKDYDNPSRKMMYDNEREMEAVLGSLDDNSFIKQSKKDSESLLQSFDVVLSKL